MNLPVRPDRPGDGNRPNRPDRPDFGGRPDRPVHLPGHRPGRPGDRWDGWDRGNQLRDRWHNRPNQWFNDRWWTNHRHHWHAHHWHYHHWHPSDYWWRWATWTGIGAWFSWGNTGGVYYDYGENVYYEDNVVYVDGEQVATADQYAEQAQAIAQTELPPEDAKIEWMPLGTFGVLTDEDQKDPTMVFQLAVDKKGFISGTYFNTATDSAQPVQGGVDRETQRAAWTVGENKNTVIETGIFNLTKDQTPVLVHFGKDRTQTWVMVRMDDPNAAKKAEK